MLFHTFSYWLLMVTQFCKLFTYNIVRSLMNSPVDILFCMILNARWMHLDFPASALWDPTLIRTESCNHPALVCPPFNINKMQGPRTALYEQHSSNENLLNKAKRKKQIHGETLWPCSHGWFSRRCVLRCEIRVNSAYKSRLIYSWWKPEKCIVTYWLSFHEDSVYKLRRVTRMQISSIEQG